MFKHPTPAHCSERDRESKEAELIELNKHNHALEQQLSTMATQLVRRRDLQHPAASVTDV